jgi:CRISPR-associated endonuclease/helicase Cas3
LVWCVNGWEKQLVNVEGSDVIFDEIHTYDINTTTAILKLIEILVAHGCKVHVGTATLPTALQNKICDTLGSYQKVELFEEELKAYERVEVIRSSMQEFEHLIEKHANQNLLIVCNTISDAQKTYLKLLEKYENVVLLHSQFRMGDRKLREKEVLNVDPLNPKICVCTQVVEVSLDIDYDVMITQLAPLDSLIQRFGRVNRRGLKGISPIYIVESSPHSPYNKQIVKRTDEILVNGVWKPIETQSKLDYVYPELMFNQALYDSFYFQNGSFHITQLEHNTKTQMYQDLGWFMESPCVMQSDLELYVNSELSMYSKSAFHLPLTHYKLEKLKRLGHSIETFNVDWLEINLIPDGIDYERIGYKI